MFDRTGLDIAQGIYTSLKFFVLLNYFSTSSFQSPNSISKLQCFQFLYKEKIAKQSFPEVEICY